MTPQSCIDDLLLPFVQAVAKGNTTLSFYQGWARGILTYHQTRTPAPAHEIRRLKAQVTRLRTRLTQSADLCHKGIPQ